jgi:hypothetical protein
MERQTQVGDTVRFLVADVFLPGPAGVFVAHSGETQLEGKVIDFSDSGPKPRAFVVVEVVRTQIVVVPIEKLEVVSGAGPEERTQ